MVDNCRTKNELIEEMAELRRRLSELEASEASYIRKKKHLHSFRDLQTVLDAMQDGILVTDLDFTVKAVNKALMETFSLSGGESVIGRKCYEVLKGRADICPDCAVPRALQTRTAAVRKSTTEDDARTGGRIYEVSAYPMADSEGKLLGAVEIAKDITDRRRFEKSLMESEEAYRTLVETSHDIIFTVDLEGRFLFANKAFEQILGYPFEDLKGSDGFLFVHPEDADSVRTSFSLLKQGERVDNLEYKYRCIDGSYIDMLTNASPIFDLRGKVTAALGIARNITDRKKSEELLKENETRFRTVFNTAKDSIFIKDKMGRYQFVNAAMEKLFDKPASELIGKNDEELFGNEAGGRMAEMDGRVMTGELVEEENTKPVMGVLRTFHVVKVPMRDSTGNILGLCGVARDITIRKGMEDELREARDQLEKRVEERTAELALANAELRKEMAERERMEEALRIRDWAIGSASHSIGFADLEGQSTYVNRAFVDMWGFDSDAEVIGKHISEFWDKGDEVTDALKYLLLHGSWHGERRGRRKDGTLFDVEVSASLVKDLSGRPVCMMAWHVDVTERKRMLAELTAAKARLQHLLTSGRAIIYSCKAEHPYGGTFISDNIKNELGYEACELLNDPNFWVDRLHPEDLDQVVNGLEPLFKNGFHKMEYRFKHKDGTYRWMRDDARLVRDADGKPLELVGYWVDITRERLLEEELLKAHKIESLGMLAGGIAHDFNNMLTGILGNIGLAKMKQKSDPEVRDLLAEAEKAAFRARHLTNQLLTFSRGGAPIIKTINLEKLLRDTTIFALRGSKVGCEFSIPAGLHSVEADEGQIEQVIHNLVINAAQAMPEGGKVEVAASNITVQETDGLPLASGEYVQAVIRDHGAGIREDQIGKVFDPYFSTKAKGQGLGLAVTYSIIKRHNGHIMAESDSGRGTAFTFYLRASDGAAVEKRNDNSLEVAGAGRILVMDDEEIIRDMTDQVLRNFGYEVELAEDGSEAIELYIRAKQSGAPFDAVIFDLTVPGGTGGKEAMSRLLKIDPRAKGIVSSGYSNDPVLADFRKYGFCGIVKKPYRMETLLEVLREVLSNSAD